MGQLSDAQRTSSVVRSFLDDDETFLEITTLKLRFMFNTELQEVVLEQGERGRHISGCPTFYKFSFGHRVSLELACKTHRLEVFHLVAPRHFANPWFVQVVSHVWGSLCMYRVGRQFSVLFVLRHTAFVFDS